MTTAIQQPIQPALATVAEAAEFLNVSRSFVYERMDDGKLAYIKIGRCRRIPWDELRRVAERGM